MAARDVGMLGFGVLLGLAVGFFFRGESPKRAPEPAMREPAATPKLVRPAELLESPREEVRTRQDDAPPALPPAPVVIATPLVEPAPVDTVGEPDSWPGEYSNKTLEQLVADEKRLRAEDEADMDAEIEKRFAEGRVETYRQGEQPTGRETFGKLVGRGDETHIRIVNIDPRYDPQFFRKQIKAIWLKGEIRKRTAQH